MNPRTLPNGYLFLFAWIAASAILAVAVWCVAAVVGQIPNAAQAFTLAGGF